MSRMDLGEALAHGTVCPRCGHSPLRAWFAIGFDPDQLEPAAFTPSSVQNLRSGCSWSCPGCGAADMDWAEVADQ